MIPTFLQPLIEFWRSFPALFYGISFLLGVYASFQFSWGLLFILTLLWLPFLVSFPSLKGLSTPLLSFLLFCSAFYYSSWIVRHPNLPEEGIKGSALLNISALTHKNSSMGKSWNYSGKILHFVPQDTSLEEIMNVPVTACLPDNESTQRPLADCSYLLKGRLKKTKNGTYIFYPEKNQPWYPLLATWSPAEWRFRAKQAANNYIMLKIPNEPSRSFLAGIATGEFENRLLSYEFSRFGLQHIMAISGFHFSIVAGILSFLLSLIAGRKIALIALMILMTLYFLFLGNAPSITRAWISCMIAFAAFLFEKPPSGLNSLGIGLFAVLIMDPEMAHHIGFQFSFTVTAAILLLYSPVDSCLQAIFPKKTLNTIIEMNSINQHGFIILGLFRQALALTIAVNLAALPITLSYFQKFPLMSVIYNFFFPWMVSISMLLLIGGLSFDLVSSDIGNLFHRVNEHFSQFVLDYTYTLPRSIDINLNLTLNQEAAVIFLGLYFSAGIYLRHFLQKKQGLILDAN